MEGIIIVNKPPLWTSFDVVAKIRNLTGIKKVGHSGTLDPMATGVLPIFIGRSATKLIDQFIGGDKGYLAEMTLGVRTDTLDATGKPQTSNCQPQSNLELQNLKKEDIEKMLEKYRGEIEQVPPMYSAKQINGQRLYKLARKGIEVERKPVKITIHKLELRNRDFQSQVPKLELDVLCSKGTYIRQLVSDIGDDLGCGAHLSKLTRTFAEPFHISQAINMETIITLAKAARLDTIIIKPQDILQG